jgi:hypothetical protein
MSVFFITLLHTLENTGTTPVPQTTFPHTYGSPNDVSPNDVKVLFC